MRILLLVMTLFLNACANQPYYEKPLRICEVESHLGTPNQIISQPHYTWYGYETALANYPVKYNFSHLAPRCPIAIPVELAHNNPKRSSHCGCWIWFKADNYGYVASIRREGSCPIQHGWPTVVGN